MTAPPDKCPYCASNRLGKTKTMAQFECSTMWTVLPYDQREHQSDKCKSKERIKRLEEAGDELAAWVKAPPGGCVEVERAMRWYAAKKKKP